MTEAKEVGHAGSAGQHAALTPRPRRLLLIGTVEPGVERAVREVQAGFPHDAAAEAGISASEAFIGSGFYAMMLEIDADDIQETLAAYFNHPAIQTFHAGLQPLVEGLPAANDRYGAADVAHNDADRGTSAGSKMSSADLPVAASMYRWRTGSMPDRGDEPEGRSGHQEHGR